jgi:hypothetical protein
MTQDELAGLTDQELLQEVKKNKSTSLINAVMFGVMIGIAMYSTWKNSIGFFTLVPLVFAYFAFDNSKKSKALAMEVKSRNLK